MRFYFPPFPAAFAAAPVAAAICSINASRYRLTFYRLVLTLNTVRINSPHKNGYRDLPSLIPAPLSPEIFQSFLDITQLPSSITEAINSHGFGLSPLIAKLVT
jgi:hypothetical protein